jgi:MinD-like ATPase involved in chromosome partitioning or flagellar assembly
VTATVRSGVEPAPRARLVVVTGGKGGPGATTLAVGLAAAWAAAGRRVLLVDLDVAGGDVAAHLPVMEVRRGVAALLSAGGGSGRVAPGAVLAESVAVALDRTARGGGGLRVLVGLPRPDGAGLLRPAVAVRMVEAARRVDGLEVVVVDAGRLLPGSVAAAALAVTGAVGVLAARADVPGALAAQRALLAAHEADAGPLAVVAVGVRRRSLADVAELAEALEHPVSGVVPACRRQLGRALQTGHPPTRRRLGRAYRALAAVLAPPDAGPGRLGRGEPARETAGRRDRRHGRSPQLDQQAPAPRTQEPEPEQETASA